MLTRNYKLLCGHVSKETAFVVDSYPYGRVKRCMIRYWIETSADARLPTTK